MAPGFIRISFGVDSEVLIKGLTRLQNFLSNKKLDIRKIPATMATQHPDNAFAPFWSRTGNRTISFLRESNEALINFKELGTGEFM